MLTKILWTVISLNTAALVIFTIIFLASTEGRNVDTMETGWMVILFLVGVVVILLAALPLRFSQSTFSVFFSAFFAFLPVTIWLFTIVSDNLPSFEKHETMAEIYFNDKTQRSIATAIEKGDTVLLKELIKGKDLNIQGTRVWDWDGLNYLQFAVRLRSNASAKIDTAANDAIIKILTAAGSASTRALAEGIKCLQPQTVSLLLDAGADPDTYGYVDPDPLLFSASGSTKQDNDMAILLVQKGASVDTLNRDGQTLLMFAANNAGTSQQWFDTWRLVRYLLEEVHADYKYTRSDGVNFVSIVNSIQVKASEEKVVMPADFIVVVEWLRKKEAI